MLYNCKQCGIEFKRSPAQIVGDTYCSRKCFATARLKLETRVCAICGGKKSVNAGSVCWDCRPSVLRKGKEVPCRHCGVPLWSTPSKPRVYCSHQCTGKGRIGHKNPAYVDGKAQTPYPSIFKSARAKVLKRDCGVCFVCYSDKPLDVHHIDRNTNNNEEWNLVSLCRVCHRAQDRKKNALELSNAMYQALSLKYGYPMRCIT